MKMMKLKMRVMVKMNSMMMRKRMRKTMNFHH
jgi:hypothetical protein